MNKTLIPAELAKRLLSRTQKSENLKLENLIDIRDLFEELEDKLRAEKKVMDFYKEAAPLCRMATKTLQDNLGIIRSYPSDKLRGWIKELGFDHIAHANWLQNEKNTKYTNASALLDAAIEYGSANGNKAMTVDEMITFALGEKVTVDFSFVTVVQQVFSRLMSAIPTSWDTDKRKAFEARVEDFKDELRRDFF